MTTTTLIKNLTEGAHLEFRGSFHGGEQAAGSRHTSSSKTTPLNNATTFAGHFLSDLHIPLPGCQRLIAIS